MKIKRFFAVDMRRTILKVREALGPDAVILSNKRVDGGFEIVAAVDYDESLLSGMNVDKIEENANEESRDEIWKDVQLGRHISEPPSYNSSKKKKIEKAQAQAAEIEETEIEEVKIEEETEKAQAPLQQHEPLFTRQHDDAVMSEMRSELKSLRGLLVNQLSGLAWGNEAHYHPLRARLLQRLIALGLSPNLAREIAEQVKEEQDIDHNWRLALGTLSQRINVSEDSILSKGGVVALVGATGVGKTTSVAKLAASYILRHGKGRVALISTDRQRVAAHEQLRGFARIMGAPMRVASDMESFQDALLHFRGKELILVDTAGMSEHDMKLTEELMRFENGKRCIDTYLVLATNSQRGVLQEVQQAFSQLPLSGCILTKVDETTSLGGALSVAVENDLPIAYFNDGQKVPDDIHLARPHHLVSKAVAIMQHLAGSNNDAISQQLAGMMAHAHG